MKAYKVTGKLGDICSFVGGQEVKKGDMVYLYSESDMKQERVAKTQEKRHEWAWVPAPIKTQWGHDMVVADLAIDKDHTVSIYCERDQIEKVEAMLSAQPEREWVGLTDGQYRDIADQVIATLEDRKGVIDLCFEQELVDEIMLEVTETIKTVTEAKLKEKNHVS